MLLYTVERMLASPASTPDQLTADKNDYAFVGTTQREGGNDELTFQRLSSDATRTITGIAAKGHGFFYVLSNVGSNAIAFSNQSSLSVAANRVITGTGGTITLAAGETLALVYDAVTERWRAFSKVFSSTGGSIDIQDEGAPEATATTLNFVGTGVTAVDQGGGVVDVTVDAGTVDSSAVVPLIHAFGGLS